METPKIFQQVKFNQVDNPKEEGWYNTDQGVLYWMPMQVNFSRSSAKFQLVRPLFWYRDLTGDYLPKEEANTKEDVIDAFEEAIETGMTHERGEFTKDQIITGEQYYAAKFPNHPTKDKQKEE